MLRGWTGLGKAEQGRAEQGEGSPLLRAVLQLVSAETLSGIMVFIQAILGVCDDSSLWP